MGCPLRMRSSRAFSVAGRFIFLVWEFVGARGRDAVRQGCSRLVGAKLVLSVEFHRKRITEVITRITDVGVLPWLPVRARRPALLCSGTGLRALTAGSSVPMSVSRDVCSYSMLARSLHSALILNR